MADETRNEIETKVKAMTETQLLERRAALVGFSRDLLSRPDGLTIDEYTELCSIYSRLRGEKGGPPSDATVLKRAAKAVDITNLADLP